MNRRIGYNQTGHGYEDERYGAPHMEAYRQMRDEMLKKIIDENYAAGAQLRILEVGFGTGLSLRYLGGLPERHELFGIDFSRTMAQQARDKIKDGEDTARLVIGDAMTLPFQRDSFDLVFATRFIHQFSHADKKSLHAEFLRVVRPGGIVALEFYARGYHWLRGCLGGRKGRSAANYLGHYPTRREVVDVTGGRCKPRPLRVAGARLLHAILGRRGLDALTRAAAVPPLKLLIDEYFVTTRK